MIQYVWLWAAVLTALWRTTTPVTQTDSGFFVAQFWGWKQSRCGRSQKEPYSTLAFWGAEPNKQPMPMWVTSPRHCEAGTACGWNALWEMDHWCRRSDVTLWWSIWKQELPSQSFILPVVHWQQRVSFSREKITNQTDFYVFLRDHT